MPVEDFITLLVFNLLINNIHYVFNVGRIRLLSVAR